MSAINDEGRSGMDVIPHLFLVCFIILIFGAVMSAFRGGGCAEAAKQLCAIDSWRENYLPTNFSKADCEKIHEPWSCELPQNNNIFLCVPFTDVCKDTGISTGVLT